MLCFPPSSGRGGGRGRAPPSGTYSVTKGCTFRLPLSTIIAVGSYHAAALSERARTLIEPGGFACAALSIAAAVYLWLRSVVLDSQKAQRNQLIWLIASTVVFLTAGAEWALLSFRPTCRC